MFFRRSLHFSLNALALTLVLCATGCYRSSEATVNGQPISTTEFVAALKLASGHKVLQKLLLQRLILQEASIRGVSLTTDETLALKKDIAANVSDPDMQRVLESEVSARLLLRKLFLTEVTEQRLKDLHALLVDDLTQREIYLMACDSKEEATVIVSRLRAGEPFSVVAEAEGKYPADKANGGLRGKFTRAQISERFEPELVELLLDLGPGQTLAPRQRNGDWVIFHVGQVFSSFDQLRPTLEELVGASKRPEFLYKLLVNANITSPYLTDQRRLPSVTLFEDNPLPWEKSSSSGITTESHWPVDGATLPTGVK